MCKLWKHHTLWKCSKGRGWTMSVNAKVGNETTYICQEKGNMTVFNTANVFFTMTKNSLSEFKLFRMVHKHHI